MRPASGNKFQDAQLPVQAGHLRDIGTLPGYDWSQPTAFNDEGIVLGQCGSFTTGLTVIFIYEGGKMYDLNTLIKGWTITYANGINQSGQIIGNATNAEFPNQRAILLNPIPLGVLK